MAMPIALPMKNVSKIHLYVWKKPAISRWAMMSGWITVPQIANTNAQFGQDQPPAGGMGRGQAAQPEDEQERRDQVKRLDLADHDAVSPAASAFGSCFLNIRSMRSVIQKPPTTLIVAQSTAIAPSTVLTLL